VASGFIHSQVLAACLDLDLFHFLAQRPRSLEEIAERTGLPEVRALPLLRAAAAIRLLQARPGGRYGLGVLGAAMVDNAPISVMIRHHTGLYRDLLEPAEFFRDPDGGVNMRSLWPYATADDPARLSTDDVDEYTELMAASQAMVADQVLAAFSFRRYASLLDVGGGSGAFVEAVHRRWPHLRLALADLPAVAEIASARLAAAGLGDVVNVIGADVSREALPGPFDVVSLVRILHDHDDEDIPDLLVTARRALAPNGVLLVAEPIASEDAGGSLIDAYFNVYLLAMGSGRPRRFGELRDLLEAAGFGTVRRLHSPVPMISSVITATPG